MNHVLLTSDLPWQHNDAIMFLPSFVFLGTGRFIQKSLKRKKKTANKHAIDIILPISTKMLFHLIVVWFHLKLCNEKRGGLLWPIARKRNLISLRSAAFFTIFVKHVIWSTPTNFTVIFFLIFLKNLTIPRLSINVRLSLVSRTLKRRKVIKWGFRYHKFPPDFVFISERPHYSLALFSSFIW